MRRALEWLGGSVLVYVLLAACAGAAGSNDRRGAMEPEGGSDGAIAAGGAPNAPGTGGERSPDAAGLGGVLDPVPPAMAAGGASGAVAAWETVDANCDKEFERQGATYHYAEVARVGRSAEDLARTIVYLTTRVDAPEAQRPLLPPDYEFAATVTFIKPGAVGALCSQWTEKAVFLVPPPL